MERLKSPLWFFLAVLCFSVAFVLFLFKLGDARLNEGFFLAGFVFLSAGHAVG